MNMVLSWLFFSIASVSAAEKPVCDERAVTRNCKFFEERKDQPMIQLSDGARIRNPMYVPRSGSENPYGNFNESGGEGGNAYGTTFSAADYEKAIENQAVLMDLLDKGRFSNRFKMTIVPNIVGLVLNPEQMISVPWPANDKKAKLQKVSGTQILKYLKDEMSPSQFESFMKEVEVQKEPVEKYMLAMQAREQRNLQAIQQAHAEAQLESQRLSKRQDRIREIFAYAKENLISVLKKGLRDDQLSKEQKAAIRKIETIKLRDLNDPKLATEPTCATSFQGNAFYNPAGHSISLCLGINTLSYPDILAIVAHELAHSIDPCLSQFSLLAIDEASLEKAISQKKISEAEVRLFRNYFEPGVKLVNYDSMLFISDQKFDDKLKKLGILKEEIRGVPSSDHIFKNENKCLMDANGFRQNESEDILYLQNVFNFSIKHADSAEERRLQKKIANRYIEALKKHPQCLATMRGESQAGEVFSDSVASLVLEKYLIDHPPKNEAEKVLSVYTWINLSCNGDVPGGAQKGIPSDAITPTTVSNGLMSSLFRDSHPRREERLRKIFLNLPGMAELFNCKRTAVPCFDHLSFYNRTSKSKKSEIKGLWEKGVQ